MIRPVPKPRHKRRKPSLKKRGEFSKVTKEKIYKRDGGLCVVCFKKADDFHHVKYKTQNGRGVFTNGVCLCRKCHDKAHSYKDLRKNLEQMMIDKYGDRYWADEWDD